MNLSRIFIERKVMTTILMVAIAFLGLLALWHLPVSELPQVDFPTIVVTANLSGADPDTMSATVATPLEKELSAISGIDSISSTSTAGSTRIILQFDLDRNIDAAAQDVQTALSEAQHDLPDEMTDPPTYRKVNPSDFPILYLALQSEHLPLSQLDEIAETQIAQQLSMVQGVAEVDVYGAQQYAVRIYLNPIALATKGLDVSAVSTALQNLNTNQPSGLLQMSSRYHLLKVDGQLTHAKAFNQAIIGGTPTGPIRLEDVGYAKDSVANDKAATWYQGKRAIVLAIMRQPDANTVAVVKAIQERLPQITAGLAANVQIKITYDKADFIKDSIVDMGWTLALAALLVAGVVFIFLRSFSATWIGLLTLPISLLGTFALMWLCHYSLDNLSLMGLILALGFVIDDAVVVLENNVRHLEEGLLPYEATLKSTQEVSFTVLAMSLSLMAVFIPILGMGGILGRLFHEFSVVVSVAIAFSALTALTLVPMLASRFLKPHKANNQAKKIDRLVNFYEKYLLKALAHPRQIGGLALGFLLVTLLLFVKVDKGFIPSEDTGLIRGSTQSVEGLPFKDFVQRQKSVADLIQANPNVAGVVSSVGQGSGGVANTTSGQLTIRLKPKDERQANADQVVNDLNQQLAKVPGLKVYLQNPPMIKIGGASSPSLYQYVVKGLDMPTLVSLNDKILTALNQIPEITAVNSDLQWHNPQVNLHLLRDALANYGLTPDSVENTLYTAYGENQISTIYTATDQYPVIMEIEPAFQQSLADLNTLYIKNNQGSLIPLSAVTTQEEIAGPLSVNHEGLEPAIRYSFNLVPGKALDKASVAIQAKVQPLLPLGVSGNFAGNAATFQQTTQTLPWLLLAAVMVIYMVLAVLYEDFLHPLTILTTLPFALLGGLLTLVILHLPLDLYGFIGLIVLLGLVKKNGIMMVDVAISLEKSGCDPSTAIRLACLQRFRPIMMTTLAAIVAALPIALGWGAGGDARQSLGWVMVGGLLFSQTFTLIVTPVFYMINARLRKKST